MLIPHGVSQTISKIAGELIQRPYAEYRTQSSSLANLAWLYGLISCGKLTILKMKAADLVISKKRCFVNGSSGLKFIWSRALWHTVHCPIHHFRGCHLDVCIHPHRLLYLRSPMNWYTPYITDVHSLANFEKC